MLGVVFWLLCACAFGAKFDGNQKFGSNGFLFVGKFCFGCRTNGDVAGNLDLNLTNSVNNSDAYHVVLFDDSQYSIYKNDSLSCGEKIAKATFTNSFLFGPDKKYGTHLEVVDKVRPHFWWVYVANCDSKDSGKISYKSHFFQYKRGSWNKELGFNEAGLNTVYLTYFIVYSILIGIQCYSYYWYRTSQYVHQLIQILTVVIGIQLLAVFFHFVDWMVYTNTGYHQVGLEVLGAILEIFASTLFTLLLLLLAQGWTISRPQVLYKKILLAGIAIMLVFQIAFFFWRFFTIDPETTQYFYNSVPMWCYGALVCIVGIVFFIQCLASYRAEALASKRFLYRMLMTIFSTWFIVPLLRILVADAFSPWSRDVFIISSELTWDTLTFLIMMILMWPSCAHKYFDLSVKDTQNRILTSSKTDSGSGKGKKTTEFERLEQEIEQEMDELQDVNTTKQTPGTNKGRYNQLADDRL